MKAVSRQESLCSPSRRWWMYRRSASSSRPTIVLSSWATAASYSGSSAGAERAKVVAGRPARLAELAAEHRGGRRPVRQRLEHPKPERVGQRADFLGAERAGGQQ